MNSGLPVVLQDGTYTYVYGLGLISQTDSSGNQSYFLGNGLGSTEALVDGSGDVVATYKYDVYGAVRSTTGGTTEYRFTGQQDDADIGYTYLRARYYDPQTGRFLSKDPLLGDKLRPQTLNKYAYGADRPTALVDLSGLETHGIGGIGSYGAGLGGTGQLMIVWDDRGNIGLLLSGGGGAYIPWTASLGFGVQTTTAESIFSLQGPVVYFGGSAGEGLGLGADVFVAPDPVVGRPYCGYQLQAAVTWKLPLPAEIHGGAQAGWVPLWINVPQLLDDLRKWVPAIPI